MLKKRLFILIILCFLVTGCTVNYNIIVTSDKKVIEDIKVSKLISKINEEGYNVEEVKEAQEASYKSLLKKYNLDYEFVITNTALQGNFSRKSSDFSSIENLTYFQQMYNSIVIEKDKNQYSFRTEGTYNGKGMFNTTDFSEIPLLSELRLNIQFHNVVIDTNADEYDEETNTYTWIFNSDTENKTIEFNLSNDKRYDIITKYIFDNYKYKIIIFISIIVLLTIFIIFYLKKYKKNNTF